MYYFLSDLEKIYFIYKWIWRLFWEKKNVPKRNQYQLENGYWSIVQSTTDRSQIRFIRNHNYLKQISFRRNDFIFCVFSVQCMLKSISEFNLKSIENKCNALYVLKMNFTCTISLNYLSVRENLLLIPKIFCSGMFACSIPYIHIYDICEYVQRFL